MAVLAVHGSGVAGSVHKLTTGHMLLPILIFVDSNNQDILMKVIAKKNDWK